MDLSRIHGVIDTKRTQAAEVAVIGAGGSARLICDLARCGVQRFRIVDPDIVEPSNIARQGHDVTSLGVAKVDAVARLVEQINPAAEVMGLPLDFTQLTDDEIDDLFGTTDLFIFATDRFNAQARGNEVATRLLTPALWIGLYAGGQAGEIIFWHPGIAACFRCLCPSRYRAHEQAQIEQRRLDPTSEGATIFDISLVDSIAGMLAIGLLTQGADNRYGRLIPQLGDRNFLQVKIDPRWQWRGRDLVREHLGIPEDCESFFAWNTIVRADPTRGEPACPDCVRFRNRALCRIAA